MNAPGKGHDTRSTFPGKGSPVSSIRTLFVVVLAIALDLYLIRYCLADESYFPYAGYPLWFRVGFAGSLPMATGVVIGGFLLLPRRGSERLFLTGFVLSGALALWAMLGLSLVLPGDWFTPVYRYAADLWWKLYLREHYTFGLSRSDYLFAAQMVLFTLLFSVPQVVLAVTGGLVARRSSCRLRANPEVVAGTGPASR